MRGRATTGQMRTIASGAVKVMQPHPCPILCDLGEHLGFSCREGSGIEAWARVADSTFFEVHLLLSK